MTAFMGRMIAHFVVLTIELSVVVHGNKEHFAIYTKAIDLCKNVMNCSMYVVETLHTRQQ
jgi:hypothetical protein